MRPSSGMRLRQLGILLAAALALVACNLQRDVADDPNVSKSRVTDAPPLSGQTLEGGHFDLAAHRGHPVVIDFWASWCGPCRKQQPELDKLATEFAPGGVIFVGVDMRDDDASGRGYISDYHVPYPSLADGDGDIAGRFDVPAPPMTLVIDRDGHIVQRIIGGITAHDLEPLLDRLVAAH